ncbi:unnamed protein product [Polarella glacialis]|uniref:THIF-type NAD/FAD binding fold domain-containing protein n=1 Tax=Polarella glacialis TaxID=89957 RepID=A0A813FF62_POLGL|nr:unnamed protein product [Polarella glacialis]
MSLGLSGAGDVCSVAPARTDLTDAQFRGFVRQDEEWPEDSAQYQAGCELENRKRPPPTEVPGDAFDRQRVICGFDQGLIERQVCLVLGAGGIGQNVALTLGRLGVRKIILVDRDVYDANNLTRQCLGSQADVGQRKVDVAARGLRECHSLRSEVEAVHCDAVLEWHRIVDLARQATVVFNGIDVGVMWDYCVNSLCKELGIPLCVGQSFGWKFSTELYTSRASEVCAFCYDSTLSTFGASERAVNMKGGILERLSGFLTSRGKQDLDVDVETLSAFLVEDRQFRCEGSSQLSVVVQASMARAGLDSLRCADKLPGDLLAFLKSFQAEVTQRLLPGPISKLQEIAFIPRPRHADTRYIGSWVCPCLGCAVMMVSQWAAWLTAPVQEPAEGGQPEEQRNPPQAITFNLDSGMTSEEQLGYELGALGVAPEKAERRFCREAAKPTCQVCVAAAAAAAEETLFFGRLPVVLAPVPGSALELPAAWALPRRGGVERAKAAEKALQRRQPLGSLGPEYAGAVLPALPALDWERASLGEGGAAPGSSSARWPPELSTVPLLKVPPASAAASAPSALRGVASGVRSALVKDKSKDAQILTLQNQVYASKGKGRQVRQGSELPV